jgi:D-alanyl-D-alanine carboxypeptidase
MPTQFSLFVNICSAFNKDPVMKRRSFIKQSALFITFYCTPAAFASTIPVLSEKDVVPALDSHIKDRLIKNRLFNHTFDDDIFLDVKWQPVLSIVLDRLKRIQKLVGYGHFCLLNFDEAIHVAASYSRVGRFTKKELNFLEMIFYSDGSDYGFRGKKPITTITEAIDNNQTRKIAQTGNYLYKGKPIERYMAIKKEIGSDVILTSGVRSVMKQFLLFLNKTKNSNSNLSMASRSLAPPGYSFHGVGDFDVGKKGYGIHNFTEEFTRTNVYHQLSDLGYVKFRYEQDNHLGVRFEPWHIEVV